MPQKIALSEPGPLCLKPDACQRKGKGLHCLECTNAEQKRKAAERKAALQKTCLDCPTQLKTLRANVVRCKPCNIKYIRSIERTTECIDCGGKPYKGGNRCIPCRDAYANMAPNMCKCGAKISQRSKMCRTCAGLSNGMSKQRPARFCPCGAKLSRASDFYESTHCRQCHAKTPEGRALRRRLRLKYLEDPEHRAQFEAISRLGQEVARAIPYEQRRESRRRAADKIRQAHLPWCPPEYWDFYVRLRRRYQAQNHRDPQKHRGSAGQRAKAFVERQFGGPLRQVSMTYPQLLRHECTVGGLKVKLAPLEVRFLMVLLMQSPAYYLTVDQLMDAVYGDEEDPPEEKVVQVYILKLRQKGIPIVRAVRYSTGYRIPETCR